MNPILLPVAELKPALNGLGKVIRKRSSLPVLGCVRVQCTGGSTIELAVTDLDISLIVTLSTVEQAGPALILIPYNELSAIAKACGPDDVIEVHSHEPKSLTLKCPAGGQHAEHSLETCAPDEFPDVPEFIDAPISLPDTLRESLHTALECISSDPTRAVLNGACLDVSRSDGHYVVGTDGRHLVASNSFKLPLTESLIIPQNKILGWKGFCTDGEWKLQVKPARENQAGWFQITTDHWRFIARQIEGKYPDWRVVMPDANAFKTQVEFEEELLEAVAQVIQRLPCHSEQYHTMGLEIKARSLRLMGRSRHDVPWTKVEVPTKNISGEAVTFFVDRQQFLKALRFGLTRIGIADAISPLLLTDHGSRQMVLMPLRLEDAPTTVAETAAPTRTLPASAAEEEQPFVPEEPADPDPTYPAMPTYEDAPPMVPNGTATHALAVPEAIRQMTAVDLAQGRTGSEQPVEKPILEAALEHIETVKSGFREGITSLSKLSEMLKKSMREQRVTQREIQSVRQTLRSLQGVRI